MLVLHRRKFGRRKSKVTKKVWKTILTTLITKVSLVCHVLRNEWCKSNLVNFSSVIHNKVDALDDCIDFLDGTVIGTARPSKYMWLLFRYKIQKKKLALKSRTIFLNEQARRTFTRTEKRRHDGALYVRSGLDKKTD